MAQASRDIPLVQVSVAELIAIAAGAMAIIGIAAAGVGLKALNNAFDATRAKRTAQSIFEYQLPGGERGVFGTQIGGATLAIVASEHTSHRFSLAPDSDVIPVVELQVAKIPLTKMENDPSLEEFLPAQNSDIVQLPGISFSYEPRYQFTTLTVQERLHRLCNQETTTVVKTGYLTTGTSGKKATSALRYRTEVFSEKYAYLVLLTTSGDTADAMASDVFKTLQCK